MVLASFKALAEVEQVNPWPTAWHPENYPSATRIGRQTVSLPLSPKLTDDDVADVIGAVQSLLR